MMKPLKKNIIKNKYRFFGYWLLCALVVALAEIYKNWMVMLQYDEPSKLLISTIIWEYVAFAFIVLLFPWSWRRKKIQYRWATVVVVGLLFSLVYVGILSLIEWMEFGRIYSFWNGLKFSFYHLPYVWVAYAFISLIIYYLKISQDQKAKYVNIKMTRTESEKVFSDVMNLLVNQEYYLRSGLKILDVSTRLDIPINKVSRSINENFQGSFSDLINTQRVNHAKKLLADPSNSDKLYAIALDSGFSNKASFHQYFKKTMDVTPQEYRDNSQRSRNNMRIS